MTFPVTVEFYDQRAKVYAPAKNFPFYRVAFKVAGKRRMLTFGTYSEAKEAAESKVKELHKGQHSSALTAKQAQDALTVCDMLAAYRLETGKVLSIVELTANHLAALKELPAGTTLSEAVREHRQSVAAVQRKSLALAVKEFCDARRPKAVSVDGKRPTLSPVYVQDTERQLTEFSDANTGADVCDLTKQHLDLFFESRGKLSPKSRNHYRATLRMFFGWCKRRDYIRENHRLLEADAREFAGELKAGCCYCGGEPYCACPDLAAALSGAHRTRAICRLCWQEFSRVMSLKLPGLERGSIAPEEAANLPAIFSELHEHMKKWVLDRGSR